MRSRHARASLMLVGLTLLALPFAVRSADPAGPRFTVRVAPGRARSALDGRLLLLVSADESQEPRFQIDDGPKSQQVFGLDVDGWSAGQDKTFGIDVLGYPRESLRDIPAGTYTVQALLHEYETFHRADGFTVKLPMDRGEGQQWNKAPGNLYSRPRKVTLDPARAEPIEITLVEDFLKTADPPYGGEVRYGDRAEHCWNGDPTRPNAISRLRYHQMFAPRIVARIEKSAPAGADLKSWRY